jgi:hypothetical protein
MIDLGQDLQIWASAALSWAQDGTTVDIKTGVLYGGFHRATYRELGIIVLAELISTHLY